MKRVKYKDLEDIVFRVQITFEEIIDILDVNYVAGSTIGNTLPPGIYEISDKKLMLKTLLPKNVKKYITMDDVRLKSNLTSNKTNKFTEKSFFYTILGFTQSHLGVSVNIERFSHLIPCNYKSIGPIIFAGTDKVNLKSNRINGSILNGIRELVLYSCGLSSPPGHKLF